jgi:hypothetical protein
MAEKKEKKCSLTRKELGVFKNRIQKALDAADNVSLDLVLVGDDLKKAAKAVPEPPPVLVGEEDLRRAQRVLRRIQVVRRKLVQMQRACLRAKSIWGHLFDVSKDWLLSQPIMQEMKNDAVRLNAVRPILGGLEKRNTRLKGYLDEISALMWALKDNQSATLSQISARKEERSSLEGLD